MGIIKPIATCGYTINQKIMLNSIYGIQCDTYQSCEYKGSHQSKTSIFNIESEKRFLINMTRYFLGNTMYEFVGKTLTMALLREEFNTNLNEYVDFEFLYDSPFSDDYEPSCYDSVEDKDYISNFYNHPASIYDMIIKGELNNLDQRTETAAMYNTRMEDISTINLQS